MKLWVFEPDNQRDDLFTLTNDAVIVAGEIDGETKCCAHPGLALEDWEQALRLPGTITCHTSESSQAVLPENVPMGTNYLRPPAILVWLGVSYNGGQWVIPKHSVHDFGTGNGPVLARRHINPDGTTGGWVADTATVEDTVTIGHNAAVSGDAVVRGNARVFDNAEVSDNSLVCGNALIFGDAGVSGNALVSRDALVYDDARVFGNAKVSGNAKVYDIASIYDDARVFGNAKVSGNAKVYDIASVFGNAEISKGGCSSGEHR